MQYKKYSDSTKLVITCTVENDVCVDNQAIMPGGDYRYSAPVYNASLIGKSPSELEAFGFTKVVKLSWEKVSDTKWRLLESQEYVVHVEQEKNGKWSYTRYFRGDADEYRGGYKTAKAAAYGYREYLEGFQD